MLYGLKVPYYEIFTSIPSSPSLSVARNGNILFPLSESCLNNCENGFDAQKKCQCDTMCRYYGSCCSDYEEFCRQYTRGDTFVLAEDDDDELLNSTEVLARFQTWTPRPPAFSSTRHAVEVNTDPLVSADPGPIAPSTAPLLNSRPAPHGADGPSPHRPSSQSEVINGLKDCNILSIHYIFTSLGKYVFELDERSVSPGFPKLIQDVWGISGPIDAAFTRINCQGKTYIFKGNKYWRFDDNVLDEDYPRDISVGFENVPDDVDAAFAVPAHSHHGKEKVYFFKGDQYYQYEFRHQPSHEECIQMTMKSPSTIFTRYTDMYYNRWEEFFRTLFGNRKAFVWPRFINKDWVGIKPPVDAVMAGRIYVSPHPLQRWLSWRQQNGDNQQQWSQQRRQQWGQQQEQGWDQQRGSQDEDRRREDGSEYYRRYNPRVDTVLDMVRKNRPVQSVFFFKGDHYYRVNLQTKRVDYANPPYPRSIGKYWLGCKENPGAERR
uniref:SMB domain-containing protein n=1 Tax=Denticeps clupeoides TaxID=299321 RepID=A0AAY4D6L2_9TELE